MTSVVGRHIIFYPSQAMYSGLLLVGHNHEEVKHDNKGNDKQILFRKRCREREIHCDDTSILYYYDIRVLTLDAHDIVWFTQRPGYIIAFMSLYI